MPLDQDHSAPELPPPPPNTLAALEYWRKKLAEETQKQLLEQQQARIPEADQDETDAPSLNELAQKLEQINFNFPNFDHLENSLQESIAPPEDLPTLAPSLQESLVDSNKGDTANRTFLRSTSPKTIRPNNNPSIDQELKDRVKQLLEPLELANKKDEPAFSLPFTPQETPYDELELSSQYTTAVVNQKPLDINTSGVTPTFPAATKPAFTNANRFTPVKQVETKSTATSNTPPRAGVPVYAFMFLLFYACVATLLCVHLFLESWVGNPRELESLPDIVPVINEGQTLYHLVPEERKLPAGHLLSIAETRRFGNIEVTPVKVTYGAVEFEHYSAAGKEKAPSPPAYKLWLEIKNVSQDQTFAPLDRELLLVKVADTNHPLKPRSNHFLCATTDRPNLEKHVLVYDLPVSGDWNFKQHPQDYRLKPGDSELIYIPSEPTEVSTTPVDMVWRVHLRKGYHPQTRHGVTTLVEVKFNTKNVSVEPPLKVF